MNRLITTHALRKTCEPTLLWKFTAPEVLDEEELLLPVPGVWETHPRLGNYRGVGIYSKEMTLAGNVRFVFGGASFCARVCLDGKELTQHQGAYTAFDCVAEDLSWGSHTLTVEVDNRFGEDDALHVPNDYYIYGGLNRPVTVEQLGSAWIRRMRAVPKKQGRLWKVALQIEVVSLSDEDQVIDVETRVAGGERRWKGKLLHARETLVLEGELAVGGVRLWSPETPNLYKIETVLWQEGTPADDLIDRIGFRELTTEGEKLLLNGQPLHLKGFNRHEDYAAFGCAIPEAAMVQDIQMMKELGCNCVRSCHYPNDPRFLDLCDQYGLLVWEEGHARGLNEAQMRNPHFLPQSEACLREMVAQHINHPCIFTWGILNECVDNTPFGASCYAALFRLLRELDPSRPVTTAMLSRQESLVIPDCDLISMNLYPRWYVDADCDAYIEDMRAWAQSKAEAPKPFIVSEIGAGAIYGFHDMNHAKWSEERQADILREQLEAVLGNPHIAGVFLWQFADCRVDDSWFGARPKTQNNKGIVDAYRRPKLAWQVVKDIFNTF